MPVFPAKQLPNVLTTLRLLLALPIGWMILAGHFTAVAWLALIAGLTDGLDGWLARKLDARSQYGAVVDPLSDKAMLNVTYLALAVVAALPWWIAILVLARDVVIIGGAVWYRLWMGHYSMDPSLPGKLSTFLQILFALLVVIHQIRPLPVPNWYPVGVTLLVTFTVFSGIHYVYRWAGWLGNGR